MLHLYRRLLQLRRSAPALHAAGIGFDSFRLLEGSLGLLAWGRRDGVDEWFSYVNPAEETQTDGGAMNEATIVLCTDASLEGTTVGSDLPASVAWVARRNGTM